MTPNQWTRVRQAVETAALKLTTRYPRIKPAEAVTAVLRADPDLWRQYRAGIAAGEVSEFQTPKPLRDTPRARAWAVIEHRGRALVAHSTQPLTLRDAVAQVVREHPELYRRYERAPRR